MKIHHAYFLASLAFDAAALVAAFSSLTAMIAFLALGMVAATIGVLVMARERKDEGGRG